MIEIIDFSTLQLFVSNNLPNRETFTGIESEFKYNNDDFYLINTELTDEYFWIAFKYGKSNPRPKEIINTINLELEPNPRGESQIEPRKQLFVLYDFTKQILYISDIRKKNFVEKILKEKTERDISLKTIFKDIESFYSEIKKIHKINFVSVQRNLFTSQSSLEQTLKDNYGIEEPEEFSLEAKFNIPLSQTIKKTINKLRGEKKDGHLKSLIIQGIDEQGFSTVFNEGTFINKIKLELARNDEGLFDDQCVKNKLMEKLYEQN